MDESQSAAPRGCRDEFQLSGKVETKKFRNYKMSANCEFIHEYHEYSKYHSWYS